MALPESPAQPPASLEHIQREWHELTARVNRLELEKISLEQENKALRFMLERVIDHRQKSHTELVLLLSGLVSKLPVNDVAIFVSKLVEHNKEVNQTLAALIKGTADADLPKPALLKALEQCKRDLECALRTTVEELVRLDTPLEKQMLEALPNKPELFFSPLAARARRCFLKGQVPQERIVKEFGPEALAFFYDMTTDPKLNPRPKPEEIVLSFKPEFEALLQQDTKLAAEKKQELAALYKRVQRSKAQTEEAQAQRRSFTRLSFITELMHFYAAPDSEPLDVIFAQRLPALVEQLALSGPGEKLDENAVGAAESILAFVVNPDQRQTIVNNLGKAGGTAKTLKYVLSLRSDIGLAEAQQIATEFVIHLIPLPPQKTPTPEDLASVLRLISPEKQRLMARALMVSDRIRKGDAEALAKAVAAALGLKEFEQELKAAEALSPEMERQMAWNKIKDLISRRGDPGAIAAAIRDRLNAKYEAEELKQSFMALIDTEPISLIRIFCQLPYRADGRTDPIARTVLESYITRLTHQKYAGNYQKVVNSLRNMFAAKPDSPTLQNFMALAKWACPDAATKLYADVGMPVPA
jgi:hypothetical protein